MAKGHARLRDLMGDGRLWCLFGVYYWRAPERLKRIRGMSETSNNIVEVNYVIALSVG
jgi:hypothetical protein